MSISIPGTLRVIQRTGRFGNFCVGMLDTEIGNFRIKNSVLDEFDEGSYEGVFLITKIQLAVNYTDGSCHQDLAAQLDWEALRIMNQKEQVEESETLEAAAMIEKVTETLPEPVEPAVPHSNDDNDNLISDAEALQALLDANANEIKLDNTLEDRVFFRSLVDTIKATGNYKFSANGQKWVRQTEQKPEVIPF